VRRIEEDRGCRPAWWGITPSAFDEWEVVMAKDHGSSVKNDKQYEGLRKKGMSKSRAAAISNSEGSSSRGGKSSGSSQSSKSTGKGSGGNKAQKKAAGRKGGKKS
jgi:hypothetical protein